MLTYHLTQSNEAIARVFLESFNIPMRSSVVCLNPHILAKLGSVDLIFKLKRLATIDCIAPGTVFRLELDLFITEDDVYRLCKMRIDMPDYSKTDSKAFLKCVPDPTSVLFFYVLPDFGAKQKPRMTFELEARNTRRVSTNSISNLKQSGTSLRFDSTMHTLKPQSPCTKGEARNTSKSMRHIDNITSNSKISSQIRSTIMKMSDASTNNIKKRISVDKAAVKGLAASVDPFKTRAGINLYQTKSRMRKLKSDE